MWCTSSSDYNGGLNVEYFVFSLEWWVECGVLRLQPRMVGCVWSTSSSAKNVGGECGVLRRQFRTVDSVDLV